MSNEQPDMPDHVSIAEQRLARDLRAAAREIDLTPGSELAVVSRGRRRRQRHRRATTFTLVTALAAGTAVGIQQLSRNGDASIASQQPDATSPDGQAPGTTAPATDPGTTLPPVPAPVATQVVSQPSPADIPDDVPPAERVDSNMVWTVVEPDSAEAVGFIMNNYSGTSRVPGVLLSTAPGRSDDFRPTLWRTDDGITWQPAPIAPPVGLAGNAIVDGSSVYAVGTAPGIAKTEANPMLLAMSSDAGSTWQQVELPVDTNARRDLPMVGGVSTYGQPVAFDGGVFVLVSSYLDLDWETLYAKDERLTDGWLGTEPGGITIATNPDCMPTVASTAPGPGGFGPLVPLEATFSTGSTAPATTSPIDCGTELITWDELDVPAETAAALESPVTRAFRVVGGDVAEVDVPEGLGFAGSFDGVDYFGDADGNYYELSPAGEVVPSTSPYGEGAAANMGWSIGATGGTAFSSIQLGNGMYTTQDLIVVESETGTTWTDWTSLYPDDVTPYRINAGVTDSGLVGIVSAQDDPYLAAGGAEVSGGGLTIRRESVRSNPTFFLTETGEELPIDRIRTDSANSDVVAVDDDGGEIARMPIDTAGPVLYGGYDTVPPTTWYVETSADGRHVAVESMAELLGVDDDQISNVPRISTDGTRTIVAVTLKERNADGVPRQLVLIGTPQA